MVSIGSQGEGGGSMASSCEPAMYLRIEYNLGNFSIT